MSIECECVEGCQCEGNPGPAIMLIERHDKEMKVCSRCKLSGDTVLQYPLEGTGVTFGEVLEYDPITGLLALMGWDPIEGDK
jgi:hypothetical protein